MNSNFFPVISVSYLKALAKINNQKDLEEELSKYANIHDYEIHEVYYVFIKELIRFDLYFTLDEEIADEILFEALVWASIVEKTKKVKAKEAKEIKYIKKDSPFTQLQQEMILSIFRDESLDDSHLKLRLNKYLVFFYEIAKVKRNLKAV